MSLFVNSLNDLGGCDTCLHWVVINRVFKEKQIADYLKMAHQTLYALAVVATVASVIEVTCTML